MKKHNTIECAIAICCAAVISTSFIAKAQDHGDKEEQMTMDTIPAAAAKAIKTQAAGAKITDVSKETDEGKTVFEAKVEGKGGKHEISVDSDGKLVSDEQEIQPAAAPAAVRSAIEKIAAGGKVNKVERIQENGKTTYEALISANGKRQEVELAEDGKVLNTEDKTHDKDND